MMANNATSNGGEVGESQSIEMDTLNCKTSFLENLTQYYKSDSLSDVTLVIDNYRYPAHKFILAASSTYFNCMFYGANWKEGKEKEVQLEETEASCKEVFPTFLQYFYSGSVPVSKQTVEPLVTLADKYDVNVLKEHCSQYMTNLINDGDLDSALTWLSFAEVMGMKSLAKRCSDLICFNLEKASSLPSWLSLSLAHIVSILERSDVVVPGEYTIYLAIQRWLEANENALDRLSDILSHIQFKNMTIQELADVEDSHLASSCTSSSVRDQINTCVLAGFRYFAIAKAGVVDKKDDVAPLPRIYLSNMQRATYSFGCLLRPICKQSSVAANSQWYLRKSDTGKYQIQISKTSPHPHYSNQWIRQSQDLDRPATIHVKLSIIFRDNDGVVQHVVNHLVDTTIPENERTLVELPSFFNISKTNQDQFTPHDILYSIEILQKQ